MSTARTSKRNARRAAAGLLAAYMLFVLWVLLRDSPSMGALVTFKLWQIAVRMGAPPTWENVIRAEFVANVAMIVPLTLLASIVWARPSWRDWTAYALVFSFGAEMVQALLLPARSATYSDVVANALGGLIGAVLGGLLVGWRGFDTGSAGASPGSTS